AGIEQAGAAAGLLVDERDIASIVRRQRQRDARYFRPHRIDRVGHRLDRDMAVTVNPREPGLELIEAADGLILLAMDRVLADGLLARGGERSWRTFGAGALLLPLTRRLALCARPAIC